MPLQRVGACTQMSYGPDQILDGEGNSDYERYIRTPELLSLQKGPDEWLHRDELLFTVVHQTSELWLKLATSEISQSLEYLAADYPQGRYSKPHQ